MIRQPWFRLAAISTAIALVATACGGRGDDSDDAGDGDSDEVGDLEAAPGFDGNTINLGVISDSSGVAADIGIALTAGNRAYFDAVNEDGGVAGEFPVEINEQDHEYDETLAPQRYDAIKDDVVMFSQLLGTPIITSLLPALAEDNIVAAPASLDAEWVGVQHLLPIGAPYQVQAANAVNYWINEMDGEGTNICALVQNDPYGEAGQEGADAGAAANGTELAHVETFEVGTGLTGGDLTPQISQLQSADCEMVFLVAVSLDTPGIMTAAEGQGFEPQWFGQSPTWEGTGALARDELADYMADNFIWTADGPQYGDESVPAMVDMMDAQDAAGANPDVYFIFGYAQAWSVHQVLEAAVANGDLSREGIVEAMNGLDEITVGGLFGDYAWGAPEDRNPPRATSFSRPNPDEPVGLEVFEADYTSDAASELEFGEG